MARLVGDFLEAFSIPSRTMGDCIGDGKRLAKKVLAAVLRSLRQTEEHACAYACNREVNRLPLSGER